MELGSRNQARSGRRVAWACGKRFDKCVAWLDERGKERGQLLTGLVRSFCHTTPPRRYQSQANANGMRCGTAGRLTGATRQRYSLLGQNPRDFANLCPQCRGCVDHQCKVYVPFLGDEKTGIMPNPCQEKIYIRGLLSHPNFNDSLLPIEPIEQQSKESQNSVFLLS